MSLRRIYLSLGILLGVISAPAHAEDPIKTLGGTAGLACEAIICLSTGQSYAACGASLAHYFGISHRKWSDTLRGRLDFLKMCPTVSNADLAKRIPEIAQGAGRCDAAYLNATNQQTAYRYKRNRWSSESSYYSVEAFQAITNTRPSYCVAYTDHEWTYDLSTKYVGEPFKGGHWVTASKYSAAQSKWAAQQSNNNDGYTYSWSDPRGNSSPSHGN